MKVYSLVLVLSALLLTSCQRDELQGGSISGEEVTVSISAVVPGDGGAVVKSAEDPGNGSEVNRCILEVYLLEGEDGSATASLYGTRHIVKMQDKKASFEDLNLITGQKYRFVLWADYVDNPETVEGLAADKFYNTDEAGGLQNVTMVTSDYAGNIDQRDAFFYTGEVTVEGPKDYTLELKRPFGQLNIITTDYGLIPEEYNKLLPVKVQLTYKNIPTGINLLTGELLTTDGTVMTQAVTGTAVGIAGPAVEGNDDAKQLSFDYIFAPANEQHLIGELTMSFLQSDGKTSTGITAYTFKSLPVQRNYRTNVSGALLTDRAGLSIEVKPGFDGTETVAEQAETIEAAQLAINAGMTDIEFTKAVNGTITLPEGTETYNISFNEGVNGDITILSDTYTGHLYIENHGAQSEHTLTIALPEGSATLDFGAWSSVSVSTADNTFILGEDVTISGTLTVNKGNVEIYGRVNSVDLQNDESIVTIFTVYDAELLKYAMTLALDGRCEKVVLGNDIELDGGIANAGTGNTAGGEDIAFVLDLSGNKLSISHDETLMNSSNGASVTIRNGDLSVMGVPSDKYTLCASDKGKITLEGLNYETTGGGVGVYPCTNGGEIYVKSCNINTSFYNEGNGTTGNGPAVMTTATGATAENTKDVLITIEDTDMESFSDAIIFNVNGRINIKNCTTKAQWHGLVLRGGTAVVENTVFTHDNHNDDPKSVSQGWYNKDWGSGNGQPRAAITVGNRGNGAYQYPSNLTLINTKAEVIGQGVNLFASMYVWANETPAYGVTITYDDATEFVGGDVIYGNDGKNITVNGKALDLSEQVFEVSNIEELLSKIQSLATSGGTLVIKECADITLTGDMFSTPLAINKPTVIKVNGTLSSGNSSFYLNNYSKLRIESSGNVNFNSKIVRNYGVLTVEGGSYHTEDLNDGCVFGNLDETAVMTLNNVIVNASRFAVAGRGRIEINGGVISSISCNWQGELAYCVRAEGGGEMTIRDAEVNGIQGCIASIEGSHILLDNVRAYAKNTEGRTDAWYALYPASLGVIEVLSGEYYSDRTPCCYASDDDIELNPIGRFIFKGGKYSSMPKVYNKSNETTSDAVAAPGYKFQQIPDGSKYKYEVVPQQ